jgi:dTDP-4-dehydrorhamnose 3,5-epimerase-like enzyme
MLNVSPAKILCMPTAQATDEIVRQPRMVASDERGIIEELVAGNFQSVLRITSKAGAIRANHYHKHDSHLCYLVSGKIEYVYRDALNEADPVQRKIINPGELFFTPPLVAHAMHFLEDSEFYAFTTQPRSQGDYEEDTIRVKVL